MSGPQPKATTGHFADYANRLSGVMAAFDWSPVVALADELLDCAKSGRQLFLCGNGGSAGNANHLANDFLYAWSKEGGMGIKVNSLSANPAIMACLANDEGYENVFSLQLRTYAARGDVLLVFSGSGNSPNILRALEAAADMGVKSYAVTAFDGGKAKELADTPIHLPIDDMQIAEDFQTIIGHSIVQHMWQHRDWVRNETLESNRNG